MRDTIFQQQNKRQLIFRWHDMQNLICILLLLFHNSQNVRSIVLSINTIFKEMFKICSVVLVTSRKHRKTSDIVLYSKPQTHGNY